MLALCLYKTPQYFHSLVFGRYELHATFVHSQGQNLLERSILHYINSITAVGKNGRGGGQGAILSALPATDITRSPGGCVLMSWQLTMDPLSYYWCPWQPMALTRYMYLQVMSRSCDH